MLHDPGNGDKLVGVEGSVYPAELGVVYFPVRSHDDPVGNLDRFVEEYGSPHVYMAV